MRQKVFTLIEILVVIVIIGILATIIIPRLTRGGKDASGKRVLAPREKAVQVGTISYVSQIQQAIMMYKMDNDERLPGSLQELKRYGVTEEMLIDGVSKQPLQYNPQTGEVTSPVPLPGRVGNALNLPNSQQGQ
jgi:prepilin-type N-terminal cleavage/methylation domain-containing protein